MGNCGSCKFLISSYTAQQWTFPAFQQTMVGNQGGQQQMYENVHLSLWSYDIVRIHWSGNYVGKVYILLFLLNGCLPGLHFPFIVTWSLFNFHVHCSLTNTQTKFLKSRKAPMLIIKCKYMYHINQESVSTQSVNYNPLPTEIILVFIHTEYSKQTCTCTTVHMLRYWIQF